MTAQPTTDNDRTSLFEDLFVLWPALSWPAVVFTESPIFFVIWLISIYALHWVNRNTPAPPPGDDLPFLP